MPTSRAYDARRRAEQPWRALYKTRRWQDIRRRELAAHPLCQRCEAYGVLVPAVHVHHVVAHKGDRARFFAGPFECLCETCHNRDAQREERGRPVQAIGVDGWPLDG